jgi:hypothetical protein
MLYIFSQREALKEAHRAADAAARVGHHRAELNARNAAMFALLVQLDLDACRAEASKAQALIEHLGALRFEQNRTPRTTSSLKRSGMIGCGRGERGR